MALSHAVPRVSNKKDREDRAVASATDRTVCPEARSARVRLDPCGFFKVAISLNLVTAPSNKPIATAATPAAKTP